MDFTTNDAVVGTVAEAILSTIRFFPGPLVFFGHEKAWEYLTGESTVKTAPAGAIVLLPASG